MCGIPDLCLTSEVLLHRVCPPLVSPPSLQLLPRSDAPSDLQMGRMTVH
jgi:hypothetical protein